MDSTSWTTRSSTFSSSSRRHQSRSDLCYGGGYEEINGEDDFKAEYMCPFCAEDFDIVGLCCHIDEEHPVEAKNWVCPVCANRVGSDIVGHITSQHGSFFKVQRKRRLRKGGYNNSTYSALRKELREANLQSLLGGSSYFSSCASIESDPLLSSFMSSLPAANESAGGQTSSVVEANSVKKSSDNNSLKSDRKAREPGLSVKDQEEKVRKSEFVRGLLLSTILDDDI